MELNIRTLTTRDFEAADTILQAAFGYGSSRLPDLRRYLSLQPDGWFFAERGGEPAGMVGAVNYGPFAWVGLMAIRPDLQRHGLGRALMNHVLDWLNAAGCPLVRLDASSAGAGLYQKLGFAATGRVLAYAQTGPSRLKPQGFEVRPVEAGEIPALADFDASIFGARREHLFALLHGEYPGRVLAARPAGRDELAGYLFAQTRNFGPWAATSLAAAEALLAAGLELPFPEPARVQIPEENGAGPALLLRAGFTPQSALPHMMLGGWEMPGRRAQIYGQASFAIG